MGNSSSCVRDNSERDYRAAYIPKSSNILTNGMQNEEKSSKTGGAKDLLQKERKGNFSWISQYEPSILYYVSKASGMGGAVGL